MPVVRGVFVLLDSYIDGYLILMFLSILLDMREDL